MASVIRRKSLGGAVAALGGLVAAACGEPTVRYVGQPQAGPAGPAGPAGAKGATGAQGAQGAAGAAGKSAVVLHYWSNLSATHPESIARAKNFTEFNETLGKDLGILVDLSNAEAGAGGGTGGSNKEKIMTLVAGGTPPDMYYTGYTGVAEYYASGATIDLDAELKTEKGWAEQRADIFEPILVSSMWAGKLVGMPGYTNNNGTIWNKGRLEQAGIEEPQWDWTWDDFIEKATKFTSDENILPYSLHWHYVWWTSYLGTTGMLPIDQSTWKMQVDTQQSLDVMEFWLGLLKNNIIRVREDGKNGLGEQYRQARNDVIFEIQGPYRIPTMRKNNAPPFGVIHNPVHPTGKNVFANNGGHNLIVFKDINQEERTAAARVAMWMNAPQAQIQMIINATSIPVSGATMDSSELNDYLKTDPELAGFVALAPYGYRWPSLPSLSKITGPVHQALPKIMLEEVSPKAGLEDAQRLSQIALDEDVKMMQG